jgi:hypothetical protein
VAEKITHKSETKKAPALSPKEKKAKKIEKKKNK